MSDYAFMAGGIFFTIFLFLVLSLYSSYYAPINCPNVKPYLESAYGSGNIINISTTVIGMMMSECSGVPWYAWFITILPVLIAFLVWVTPFIG